MLVSFSNVLFYRVLLICIAVHMCGYFHSRTLQLMSLVDHTYLWVGVVLGQYHVVEFLQTATDGRSLGSSCLLV